MSRSSRYDDLNDREVLLHALEQAASACRFALELEHRKGRKGHVFVAATALFVGLSRFIEELPERPRRATTSPLRGVS